MLSRRFLWLAAVAFLGVLGVTWWAGSYPARITIINTSGAGLEKLTIESGDDRINIATIANGEFRNFTVRSGQRVVVRCGSKTWQSAEPLAPAQAVVLYILPGVKFEARAKLSGLPH